MKNKSLLIIAVLSIINIFRLVEAAPNHPDIVFILLDDLRYDGLSCAGHPYVKTPNIDALRERGAWMENAFVTTSICCPSRATFLTGTYASRHGVIDNETSEYNPEVTPPVTKYLQEVGYKTAMIGKWHMGHTGHPRPYFDYWLSFKGQGKYFDPLFNINGEKKQFKGYTTDLLTDKAIEFIESQPVNQPYFCMLSHKAVHEPFKPHPRHKNAFGADTSDILPPSWKDDFKGKPEWMRREQVNDWRWAWRNSEIEKVKVPNSIPSQDWGQHKKYIQQYRCLAAVDEGVGRVINALEKRGTLENTLIVFTSDNGYFHGEHRRWDKRLAYEESIRIPMIVVYPGKIKTGSSVSQMIANVDFAPTILNYAGLPIPENIQGASMRPLFEEKNPPWRSSIFYEYWVDLVHSVPTMTAVRNERYKLVHYPEENDIDELYDLKEDPHELTNLAENPEYAAQHKKMTALLQSEIQRVGWSTQNFPKNLPRFRGPKGILLNLDFGEDGQLFTGKPKSVISFPFDKSRDPSAWPFRIDLSVKAESDGVVLAQAGLAYGYKIFIQDGKPGISTLCKTWKSSQTTIDAKESIIGKWTKIQALIDYNRLAFMVNGELIDSAPLPQPFKYPTKVPLTIGGGKHALVNKTPNAPFKGTIRQLMLQRELLEKK